MAPHVAQNTSGRASAIDGRTTRHGGYVGSQRIRKRIEEAFGWIKTVAAQGETKFRSRERVGWAFFFAVAACNMVRLPKADDGDRLMAKVPAFAKAFAGRWRIVEMDNWDNDVLDLVEEAHLRFDGSTDGENGFAALKALLDVRYGARDGSACAELSWEGQDENDPACGRGWAATGTAGCLIGHFYIHNGDDSGFVCERA